MGKETHIQKKLWRLSFFSIPFDFIPQTLLKITHMLKNVWEAIFQVLLVWRECFAELNHATDNLWENAYTIHLMKHTIGWEFNGTEGLRRGMGIDIQRSSHWNRFSGILYCYEMFIGKHMHFPCDLEYNRVGISWKRSTLIWNCLWIIFAEWLSNERLLVLFSARTIFRFSPSFGIWVYGFMVYGYLSSFQ